MKKKLLSLLLAVVMVLSMIPMGILASTASTAIPAMPLTLPEGTKTDNRSLWIDWSAVGGTEPITLSGESTITSNLQSNGMIKLALANQNAWCVDNVFTYDAWHQYSGLMFSIDSTECTSGKTDFLIELLGNSGHAGGTGNHIRWTTSTMAYRAPAQGGPIQIGDTSKGMIYYYENGAWQQMPMSTAYYYGMSKTFTGWVYIPFTSFWFGGASANGLLIDDGTVPVMNLAEYMDTYGDHAVRKINVMTNQVGTKIGDIYWVGQDYGIQEQSVTLENDLSLNIYADLPVTSSATAAFEINGKTTEVVGEQLESGTYKFTYSGILPQMMGETISVTVPNAAGKYVTSFTAQTSIAKYCNALWNDGTMPYTLRHLVADLLRYGAEAQKYSGFSDDALVTEGWDLTGYGAKEGYGFDISSNSIPSVSMLSGSADENYALMSARLRLEQGFALTFKVKAADLADLSLVAVIENSKGTRESTIPASAFTAVSGSQNTYTVLYQNIGAEEMDSVITVYLTKNGEPVGQTLTYSVASYIKSALSRAEATGEEDLLTAIYAYGLSAKEYVNTEKLVLADESGARYVVVRDDSASEDVIALIDDFVSEFFSRTGTSISVITDAEATGSQGAEIIIGTGEMNGRGECGMPVFNYEGYAVTSCVVSNAYGSNTMLVVNATTAPLLELALEKLMNGITRMNNDFVLPIDYCAQSDLPLYSGGTQNVYYCGEYNYELNVQYTNQTAHDNFILELKNNWGYKEYTTNEKNGNLFGTYVCNEKGTTSVVHTMFYPSQRLCKIVYGPLGYLPETQAPDASEYQNIVVPSITQMALLKSFSRSDENVLDAIDYGGTNITGAPGMSYVIQLPDASFVLIDGGNRDGTVTPHEKVDGEWVRQETTTSQDAKNLYDFLCGFTPDGGKPVIAAWFITHCDGDHIGLPTQFIKEYNDKIDLRMVAYNFPDFTGYTTQVPESSSGHNTVNNFKNAVDSYFPEVVHWIAHTGQKLYLPGCEIEILATVEDYYSPGRSLTNNNDSSLGFRVTLGDTTFMVLGDMYSTNCGFMANVYGTTLKSDILQLAHHGFDVGTASTVKTLYQLIDPDICFWPCDGWRFEEDTRINGSRAHVNNAWIKNGEYNEATGTRPREHYHASVTTTIKVDTVIELTPMPLT